MEISHLLNTISKEQLFEILIDQLDGFFISDHLGRYVYVNQRWCEMTGFSFDQVKGLYVHDVMPETLVDVALKEKRALKGELIKIKTSDGEDLHLLCSYNPIIKDGDVIGCFNVSSLIGMENVMNFNAKTTDLLQTLNHYKKELADMQGAKYSIQNIIGSSDCMTKVKADIHRAARSSSTVIIQGETGTGKELVAHSIHVLSPRADRPFIKINCAAIPDDLLESELFGYESGAFTGANKNGKKGKFLMANHGTLFLDEINQMPMHLQPKLLRALQEREIEPIGSTRTISVDCRIIAASNQPLDELVKNGQFREDLYYRLNVFSLHIPPLRERKSDISAISDAILSKLNLQLGMKVPGISNDAKQLLTLYDWPGNVRELQNVIERAMNVAWIDTIGIQHLDPYFKQKLSIFPPDDQTLLPVQSVHLTKQLAEKDMIIRAIKSANGNKTLAAKMLGITRAMLYRKIKAYDLKL